MPFAFLNRLPRVQRKRPVADYTTEENHGQFSETGFQKISNEIGAFSGIQGILNGELMNRIHIQLIMLLLYGIE